MANIATVITRYLVPSKTFLKLTVIFFTLIILLHLILGVSIDDSLHTPNTGFFSKLFSRKEPQEYKFGHFLEQTKNPCFYMRHESELFEGLLSPASQLRLDIESEHTQKRLSAVTVRENGHTKKEYIRCLPYYYVLGWPKCGTSDLYAKMLIHPNILHPTTKEPMWYSKLRFEKDEVRAVKTLTTILTHTATKHITNHLNHHNSTNQIPDIVGEHSTHTIDMWTGHKKPRYLKYSMDFPEASNSQGAPPLLTYSTPHLIRRLVPEAKLIVLMRDPVERYYSLYKMHEATSPVDFHNGVINGINWWQSCMKEGLPLGECMYTNPRLSTYKPVNCTWHSRATGSARKSIYYLFLKEWLSVFPREQFLFLKFEDYIAEEVDTINKVVFSFLDLPSLDEEGKGEMAKVKRQHIVSFEKNSAGNKINHNYREPMLEKTRQLLRDFYRPYNKQLADLLNDKQFLWDY